MSFILSLIFSIQQHWRTRGWNRFCLEVGDGSGRDWGGEEVEGGPKMYTHVNEYKNDKIKERK
jgi:hypothetical protein